jgi:hypothetical protein
MQVRMVYKVLLAHKVQQDQLVIKEMLEKMVYKEQLVHKV